MDDAWVIFDWSTFVFGVLLLTLLPLVAGLLGWLAARLLVYATRVRAEPTDRRHRP